MNVSFHKPVVLADRGCHSFTLIDVPVFESVTEHSAISIDFSKDCSGQLGEFVSSFLLKASKYFSKELPASTFIEKLRHRWNTAEFLEEELKFVGQALLKWIPATVLFYRGFYEIEWDLLEIILIPPEPMPQSEPECTAQTEPEPAPHSEPEPAPEPAPQPEPEPATEHTLFSPTPLEEIDIPSASTEQLTETTVKRQALEVRGVKDAYKEKVRKARLRAVLAQLRAEKLAEQYYLRYGNLDLEDGESSDSDLSFQDGYT